MALPESALWLSGSLPLVRLVREAGRVTYQSWKHGTRLVTGEVCPKCGSMRMWFAPRSKTLRCDNCNHVVNEVAEARREDQARRPA